jgi:hypothetical protein
MSIQQDAYVDYRAMVVNWLARNRWEASEHIIDIIVSVLMTRDNVHVLSSRFVDAVINNDLGGAVMYGDEECQKNLTLIYKAKYNINTYHLAQIYRVKEPEEHV